MNLGIVFIDDSMKGIFKTGDFVRIDKDVKSYQFDGVYAYELGDDKFIARLQFIPGKGLQALQSDTSQEDLTITDDMDFKVVGRVVKGWVAEDVSTNN